MLEALIVAASCSRSRRARNGSLPDLRHDDLAATVASVALGSEGRRRDGEETT